MLFNLSLKNFRKSIRDYSIYFFTMILGVAVFYIFNAIETQTATIASQAETIEEMEAAGNAETVKAELSATYEEGVESNG